MNIWPWPHDSREDAARRVAASYRRLCQQLLLDPEALDQLDQHWVDLGQSWIVPTQAPLDPDDWITEDQAAELFHQPVKSIYDWGRRGRIRVREYTDGRRVNVGDIIHYSKQRHQRRQASLEGSLAWH